MVPHERMTCAGTTRTCLTPDTLFPKLGGRGRVTQPLQTQKAELVVSYGLCFVLYVQYLPCTRLTRRDSLRSIRNSCSASSSSSRGSSFGGRVCEE